MKLVGPLLNHDYNLWKGNFYNCLELARFLKSKETDHIGIVYMNRKIIPSLVKAKKQKKGEQFGQHSGDAEALTYYSKT
jgi:hypothetical protein